MGVDVRDLRDPQKLGQAIMDFRDEHDREIGASNGDRVPLHHVIDHPYAQAFLKVPDYDPTETLGVLESRRYMAQLQRRAMDGDKFAKSMLEHYEKHGTFQGAPAEPVDA